MFFLTKNSKLIFNQNIRIQMCFRSRSNEVDLSKNSNVANAMWFRGENARDCLHTSVVIVFTEKKVRRPVVVLALITIEIR